MRIGALLLSGLLATAALAQNARPELTEETTVSPARLVTVPSVQHYLYIDSETSYAEMAGVVEPAIEKLTRAMESGEIQPRGSVTFVYVGANSPDPDTKFQLHIGVPVSAGSKAIEGTKIRELPEALAASVVLHGSIQDMAKAFQVLMPAAMGSGMALTEERREIYVHWEGYESANNVVVIQLPVEKRAQPGGL